MRVGDLDDPTLPQKVILVFVADGGWHLQTALCRFGDDERTTYLPPWSEPWSDAGDSADWRYLSERVLEGRGGNGQTYEVEGFAAGADVDVEPLVVARAAEVVVSTGGPLGEVAHTIAFTGDDGSVISMPFVVLFDEEGDVMLVATDATGDGPVSVIGDGVENAEMVFRSVTHWQRDFARCWPLGGGIEHQITWDRGSVFLIVDDVGSITRLSKESSGVSKQGDDNQAEPAPDRLERFARPEWATLGSADTLQGTGEAAAWGWAIPAVLRASAGSSPEGRWPAPPGTGAELEDSTGYWVALLHVLLYTFGWARPDRGLRWWYDAGQPRTGRRLALIADTYLADGQLDWFAAWLWTGALVPPFGLTDVLTLAGADIDDEPVNIDSAFVDRAERAAVISGIPAPLGGGSDPLHLKGHAFGPTEPSFVPSTFTTSTSPASGILVTEQAFGWYRTLVERGSALSPDEEAYVDVILKPVGWIGSFRRSPSTRLWHAVTEDVHVRGN